MKRLFAFVCVFATLLAATACGSSSNPPAEPAVDQAGTEPAPSETPALDYPKDNIRIIVPYDAGGANDILARVLASVAGKNYINGHSLIVENMGGGGAVIGQSYVANTAPADGYTLLLYTTATVNNTFLKDDIGYTYEDFKPIIGCNTDAQVLAVAADSPYSNLDEFFAAAKEAPLLCSTSGFGSGTHNLPMYMESLMGVQFEYVHESSGALQLTDLLGGHCDFALFTVSEVMSAYSDSQIKILGVMSAERDAYLPDIPTFKEQGYDGWIDGSNRAVGCRADLPDDIYQYLIEEFTKLVSSQEYIDTMNEVGMNPLLQTTEEYQDYIEYKVDMMTELAPIIKKGA